MPKTHHFEIIRASRRTISIQISRSKGLIVRAPFSVPEDIIHAFVEKKSDWIAKHLSIQKESKGSVFYYLGKPCSFEYNLLQKKAVTYSESMFTYSAKIQDIGAEKITLTRWYREQAQLYLNERVKYFSQKHNFTYQKMKITSAVTRWGSCSGNNTINFPWRLMMAPKETIDYVVVHELSHTVHKNHSSQFWNLVESIMPDWKIHRTHLREEGWKYHFPPFYGTAKIFPRE